MRNVCSLLDYERKWKTRTIRCISSTHSSEVSPGLGVPQSQLGRGYPSPSEGVTPVPARWVPPSWTGVSPGKDLGPGKEPGTGVPPGKDLWPGTRERTWDFGTPQKGPETRDQRKNLGTGLCPLWMDRHLWKHYLPASLRNAGGRNLILSFCNLTKI